MQAQPGEVYRRLLRDLAVDLAQDVAEFRASRVLDTNHYHRTSGVSKGQHYTLHLDTGAGPR